MREDFLHHIWSFQKFYTDALFCVNGEALQILHPGILNGYSGPDFFNARLQIDDQLWAGNVEIHIKSSDWYAHGHETDVSYDNVILHVVWQHDVEIFRKNGNEIPVLELKNYTTAEILNSYSELLERDHLKINCEKDFSTFSDFQLRHWTERLYFERLERKSADIRDILLKNGNNWEASFFILLCKTFGLNVNAEAFQNIATSFNFGIVQKLQQNRHSLEALFLGQAQLLEGNEIYVKKLSEIYAFQKVKFSLSNDHLVKPQFFRLRPDNFPTIRLAQLAALYSGKNAIFEHLMGARDVKEIYQMFHIEISEYWQTHFTFGGKQHKMRSKGFSRSFVNLLIINCIIPFKYHYMKYLGKEDPEAIQSILNSIPAEKNALIGIFERLRPLTIKDAMDSQALIQLKKEYCDKNRCLKCELGASLLKNSHKYV